MTKLFAGRKFLISSALALLAIGICIVSLLLSHSRTHQFALRSMGISETGPEAIFQKERHRPHWILPKIVGIGFQTRFWVYRHKQWTELPLSEIQNIVHFHTGIQKPGYIWIDGYTVTVKVPVCERWKIETEIGETKRLGWKALSLRFTSTNRWQSVELPGWSMVHNQFRTFVAASESSLLAAPPP